MKVVINTCFGGFSLSARGVQRMAELQGRPCYFFKRDISKGGLHAPLKSVSVDQAEREFMCSAYDVPNPDEILPSQDRWHEMTDAERKASNDAYEIHTLETRPEKRDDPNLIRVVEELGIAANGKCADLSIVEIPDGTDYVIEEYDGNEHIAEAHRTWR